MASSSVTPPEGLHPDSLPPEFDGWDSEPGAPTHPLGTVTGIDHDSGLPIVKRKPMGAASEAIPETPEADSESQEMAAPVPLQPASPLSSPGLQNGTQQAPVMQKGTPISFGGQPGRIVYVHPQLGVARVMMDDGKKIRSVNTSALKVLPHVVVQSHVRRLSS